MTNKQYRRLQKSLKHRKKQRLNKAWRNIFVKAGILED